MKYDFEEFIEKKTEEEMMILMKIILIGVISAMIIACCFWFYYAENARTLYVVTATGEEMTGHFILRHRYDSVWVRLEDGTMEKVIKYKVIE